MKIGIDMMGGDFAPLEAVRGIRQYLQDGQAHLLLLGDEAQVAPLLEQEGIPAGKYTLVHAPQVIDMHEHPTRALKEKQQSSIAIGFHLLASGKMDAFISAGNTGAMLVGSLYALKPLEGVLRPTISTIIPKENGKTGLLLDVGLNSDCKPEHLNQFARMGSIYARHILGIDNPRVALLNIGEEEGKGNLLAQATYPLLKANTELNFVGNVEGRDILLDKADVMVCDGFTGNIILKLAESLFEIAKQKQIDHEYFNRFNFENYGGTPVLGISKPVIIGHGISKSMAFHNMITLAQKMIYTGVMQQMSI
ncbi:phosphate acyltransferase PlsX [Flaviaesturariibacter flavus]|uniref:Phosphate acyltransferase n=1 Tax=Flaviaesturariibacter flavus TaxID=2502780 RepID=A0A4R1BQ03_9BACT|nr:phosphate acyltransferase PlsX [Flaviaesturariibacter flavus]TCJ19356.1 phosphate acyltransferase PlsX [Flaviaesturariibacter flavus]